MSLPIPYNPKQTVIPEEFKNIAPYEDDEILSAIRRVLQHKEALYFICSKIAPDVDFKDFVELSLSIKSVEEYQMKIGIPMLMRILNNSTEAGLTCEGFDQLEPHGRYLFVSNHRDITLDAAMFIKSLYRFNLDPCEIAFGDNLIANPLIGELARINRMFPILRGGTRREFYQASLLVSKYIRYCLTEKNKSVWIAQRNGRTKNGDDRTEPGLMKMFSMSGTGDFVEDMDKLHIVPVAISYENEPCANSKIYEQLVNSRGEKYSKGPNEDMMSVMRGILEQKGAIHITVCKPLSREEIEQCAVGTTQGALNDSFVALSELIDRRIHNGYHLFQSNLDAYEKLKDFEPTVPPTREELMLQLYANPVINKQGR